MLETNSKYPCDSESITPCLYGKWNEQDMGQNDKLIKIKIMLEMHDKTKSNKKNRRNQFEIKRNIQDNNTLSHRETKRVKN